MYSKVYLIFGLSQSKWRPQLESNQHLSLRRALFYPLNYGDLMRRKLYYTQFQKIRNPLINQQGVVFYNNVLMRLKRLIYADWYEYHVILIYPIKSPRRIRGLQVNFTTRLDVSWWKFIYRCFQNFRLCRRSGCHVTATFFRRIAYKSVTSIRRYALTI